jgi:hypothetical protein
MKFFPHESVEVPRQKSGLIAADRNTLNLFWAELDAQLGQEVSEGIGCYVFSVRAGRGVLPWYVGKAERQSFRSECFAAHKVNHYNNIIASRRGTPLLTLIAKYTPTNRLVKPGSSDHRDIDFLETMIISAAIRRNPDVFNIRDTMLLREMTVPGMLNTPRGKAHGSVAAFREVMGT